jgi:hypothetical protein
MENVEEEKLYEEKIDTLLSQFEEQRNEIKSMIQELETIKGKIDVLIPNTLDKRYFRFFEEKVKAVTGFFNILLEMRKEITKTLKDEIELRRKVKIHDDDFDPEKDIDLRDIAKKIEKLNKEKEKTEQTIEKTTKKKDVNVDEPVIEEIDIPGINTPLQGT